MLVKSKYLTRLSWMDASLQMARLQRLCDSLLVARFAAMGN